ncbi:hypothetical protein [Lactiplantibacillus pentosus]
MRELIDQLGNVCIFGLVIAAWIAALIFEAWFAVVIWNFLF